MPKRMTAPIPAAASSRAFSTRLLIEEREIPGIEEISSLTPSPATTNSGWIRSAAESSVSRTRPRGGPVRRRRRMRVAGNGIGGEFREGTPNAELALSGVQARGLVKRYGDREALKGVGFEAAA